MSGSPDADGRQQVPKPTRGMRFPLGGEPASRMFSSGSAAPTGVAADGTVKTRGRGRSRYSVIFEKKNPALETLPVNFALDCVRAEAALRSSDNLSNTNTV